MNTTIIEQFCCICIEQAYGLEPIQNTDEDGVKYIDKLFTCVVHQNWEEYFRICNVCLEKLRITYSFIQSCVQSEKLRCEQIKAQAKKHKDKEETKNYICNVCQKEFKLPKSLQIHCTKVHSKLVDQKNENDTVKTEYCDKVEEYENEPPNYSSSDRDENEEPDIKQTKKRVNRSKNPLTCEYCGKVFYRRQHCLAHIRCKHTFEKPYKCNLCDASYTNSHSLLVHKRNHNNEKPFVCSFCGKSFVCSGDLYHHSKIHFNKREYKCPLCEKSFNTASILRAHRICMHTDPTDWKYVCVYCPKRFPINSSLVAHMKRHSGSRKVACHVCEKKFYDNAELNKHLRTHSVERNFKCNLCKDKGYKNNYGLKKHMKIVHDIGDMKISKPERKFQCSMCPKAFTFNNKLQKHIRTHTGEKPFKCHLCDKKFTDNYYKKVHLKKRHDYEMREEDK